MSIRAVHARCPQMTCHLPFRTSASEPSHCPARPPLTRPHSASAVSGPHLANGLAAPPLPLGSPFPWSPDTPPGSTGHLVLLFTTEIFPDLGCRSACPESSSAPSCPGPSSVAPGALSWGRWSCWPCARPPQEACEEGCTSQPCLSPGRHLLGWFITRLAVLLRCSHCLALSSGQHPALVPIIPIVPIAANTSSSPCRDEPSSPSRDKPLTPARPARPQAQALGTGAGRT